MASIWSFKDPDAFHLWFSRLGSQNHLHSYREKKTHSWPGLGVALFTSNLISLARPPHLMAREAKKCSRPCAQEDEENTVFMSTCCLCHQGPAGNTSCFLITLTQNLGTLCKLNKDHNTAKTKNLQFWCNLLGVIRHYPQKRTRPWDHTDLDSTSGFTPL